MLTRVLQIIPTPSRQVDDLLAYHEGRAREEELGQQLESIGGAQHDVRVLAGDVCAR